MDVAEGRTLALRKAEIWNSRLGDTMESISVLGGILESAPEEGRAMDALEQIVRISDHREAAFKVLEPVLAGAGQWIRTYELLDTLAAHRDDTFERIEALHQMGSLAEHPQ